MKRYFAGFALLLIGGLCGCRTPSTESASNPNIPDGASLQRPASAPNLLQARAGFKTKLQRELKGSEPIAAPPANSSLKLVQYESPAGKLAAYVSTIPQDGKKHPAIIWIFGGFGNDIGDTAWEPADPANDQSAQAFRKSGIVTMYPSFRGGGNNPGVQEGFYGEVDDVLAAADYLAKQPGIDPGRIYLGGHSTGGTLALLVAGTATPKFRAVFSFGPIDDVIGYGSDNETRLRAPYRYLNAIVAPTFIFEGAEGNALALESLKSETKNPIVRTYLVGGHDHFTIISPVTETIVKKILADTGATCNIMFSQ
jgi:acetyl esterase/lipase